MPLGQLSTEQVQRGYEVLERIRKVLGGRSGKTSLEMLSSEFYQASQTPWPLQPMSQLLHYLCFNLHELA